MGRAASSTASNIVPLLSQRTRPVTRSDEQLLPVIDALAQLVPNGGLRRGSTVGIAGAGGTTSLALALASQASAEGSWIAMGGLPDVGLLAAAELGIALERCALIDVIPPRSWGTVMASLVGAVDLLLVRHPRRIRATDARRLAARQRERGTVIVNLGTTDGADLRFHVVRSSWHGIEAGHGRLIARRLEVAVDGKGAASRPRNALVWLPDADGNVRVDVASAPSRQLRSVG